jgi:uncharacterized protein
MEPQAILAHLAQDEGLPEAAILAARERWAEVAPLLIDLVERAAAGDPAARALQPALFVGFHLLGERQEKAAYRPLARLLAIDADAIDALLGNATVETAHRVMAAVFDGDPKPLHDVIEAEHADPFVRSRMVETLALLVLRGGLERDAVARYLRDAFMNLRPHGENHVWVGWQAAIAMLGLKELAPLVRKAFDRGLIDPALMSLEDFRSDLRYALAHPDKPWPLGEREYAPFEDALGDLAGWYAVADDEPGPAEDDPFAGAYGSVESAVNPFRNVGRNDPCPCGSGRKFKKCCLP